MRSASSPDLSSDTHLLVDACIAGIREAAGLDDDVVLPPLPKLTPRHEVVVFTQSQTELAAAAAAAAGPPLPLPVSPALAEPLGPLAPRPRSRWPFRICAFVAIAAAVAAILASPLGRRPSVERVTHGVGLRVLAARHAIAHALGR